MPLATLCLAAVLAVGSCSASPQSAPPPPDTVRVDTTLYPSAAVTNAERGPVLVRDLDELGVTPVGMTEAELMARLGAPDREVRYDPAGYGLVGEERNEVYNVIGPRLEAGEPVVVRELVWELPNNWRRMVWLHDAPGGWKVADGLEWANDRIDF